MNWKCVRRSLRKTGAMAAATPGTTAKGDAKEAEDSVSYYLSCHHPRRAEFFAELNAKNRVEG